MFSFLQMPFLQALGYAIANSIWQIFLLWLIVIIVYRFVKTSSHTRYVTALSAQAGGFVWFLTTLQFYYRHCEAASVQAEQLVDNNTTLYAQSLLSDNNRFLFVLIKGEETLPYLSIAYLVLLLVLMIRWLHNFRFTKQLSGNGLTPADHKWQVFVNEMADRLDILQEVKVYVSSVAKSPLTIGYIKPIILLPVASVNHLSVEQVEAVLLHELAHIKRSDYIINIFVSVAEMVLFFNPFTRLLSRYIQMERENCCDDWVLQYQYSPAMYAEALLHIACLQQSGFQMSAASQPKGDLLQRVKRMVQPAEKRFTYKRQVAALLLITVLLFSIAWLQPRENSYRKAIAGNDSKNKKTIVITPLIAQVDNPFFNGASLFSSSIQDDVNKALAQIDKSKLDSVAQTSITMAQETLHKAAPQLLTTISSGNWQKMVSQATEDASKSLQTIDWSDLQQDLPDMADSLKALASLNVTRLQFDKLNQVKESLAQAKKTFEDSQPKDNPDFNFSFDNNFLKQFGADALASVQSLNFKSLADSVHLSVNKINRLAQQQKIEKEEWLKKKQEWIKGLQKTYQQAASSIKQPAIPQPPAPPAPPEEDHDTDDALSITDAIDTSSSENDNWSFSEPVYRAATGKAEKLLKTIHIISNSDSNKINIVIEIRQ